MPVLRRPAGDAARAELREKLAGLPVAWVDDWAECTPARLREWWDARYRSGAKARRAFDLRRAAFPFWLHRLMLSDE